MRRLCHLGYTGLHGHHGGVLQSCDSAAMPAVTREGRDSARTRTEDHRLKRTALYHLSYGTRRGRSPGGSDLLELILDDVEVVGDQAAGLPGNEDALVRIHGDLFVHGLAEDHELLAGFLVLLGQIA